MTDGFTVTDFEVAPDLQEYIESGGGGRFPGFYYGDVSMRKALALSVIVVLSGVLTGCGSGERN